MNHSRTVPRHNTLDQEIQSRQGGDVIASYQWFKVVAFGKKRRYNEVD